MSLLCLIKLNVDRSSILSTDISTELWLDYGRECAGKQPPSLQRDVGTQPTELGGELEAG
jgi:hypothetical protein